MKRNLLFATAMCAAAAASTFSAEPLSLEGRLGVGLGAGVSFTSGDYGPGREPYGRALLRYNATDWLGMRLTGGYGSFSGDPGKGADLLNGGADFVIQPPTMSNIRPYLASGVSVVNAKVWGTSDEYLITYIPAEFGVEWFVSQNVSLWTAVDMIVYANRGDRFDGLKAGTGSLLDRRDDYQRVTAGITFSFGSAADTDGDKVSDKEDKCSLTPQGVSVDKTGCPIDGDKDGVADYLDKCLGTSEQTKVDAIGCPLDGDGDGITDNLDKCANTPPGVKVDPAGCPVDTDKDGVTDDKDKCPRTPTGATVDETGCLLDTDKDGVTDNVDACPGTAPGIKVDATGCSADNDADGVLNSADKCPGTQVGWKVDSWGCPIDSDKDGVADGLDKCPATGPRIEVDADGCQVIKMVAGTKLVLDGIIFQTGKSVVDEVSRPTLERTAQAIQRTPDAHLEIAGFTDNKGSAAANRKLSTQRAESVRNYLISLGVNGSQLTAKGYGITQPVADNNTADGRAQNRRIEFRVK